jgi:thiamine-monophosphate kinase
MRITRLGEFGLIERIKARISSDASVKKGIGDDCAVLAYNKDKYLLLTCDMLLEGVDFKPHEDPYFVGRKAIAVSLSDIAACAGLPRHCLVSLGMPRNTSVKFFDRLLAGMLSLARKYNVNIVGGDLSRASELVIDVSMLGIVEKKRLVLRSGACLGDIIFVSAPLGGSIKGKHLRFTPRIKEARFLTQKFKINSMIDISDGLAQDLSHILKTSNVGAFIYEGLIPLDKKAGNLQDALFMGEDFELLFTLASKDAKKLISMRQNMFWPIGEIVDKKYNLRLVDQRGRLRAIPIKGFRHF